MINDMVTNIIIVIIPTLEFVNQIQSWLAMEHCRHHLAAVVHEVGTLRY